MANSVQTNPLPLGRTTNEKLTSMRAEAAADLLRSTTWRSFFEKGLPTKSENKRAHKKESQEKPKEAIQSIEQAPRESENTENLLPSKSASLLSLHIRKQYMHQNLDHIYNNLLYRVEELWDALKISNGDRKFYRKSFFHGPVQSVEHCQELAAYVLALQQYKAATLEVLQSIKQREESVTKFYERFASLQRKISRLQIRELASVKAASDQFSTASLSVENNNQLEKGDDWKEELIYALDEVRCDTLEVIKNIQLWRRHLWRPLPFIWNNINYLNKLRTDLNILESESGKRILNLLPIRLEDLLGVVIYDFRVKGQFSECGSPESNDAASPPLSPLPMSTVTLGFTVSHIHGLVQEFVDNIPRTELQKAALVVVEEERLQQAVRAEQQALLERGLFIPSLRLRPHSKSRRKELKQRSRDEEESSSSAGLIEPPNDPAPFPTAQTGSAAVIFNSFPPYKPFVYEPANNDCEEDVEEEEDNAMGEIGELGIIDEPEESADFGFQGLRIIVDRIHSANSLTIDALDGRNSDLAIPAKPSPAANAVRDEADGEEKHALDDENELSLYASFEKEEREVEEEEEPRGQRAAEAEEEEEDLYNILSLEDGQGVNGFGDDDKTDTLDELAKRAAPRDAGFIKT